MQEFWFVEWQYRGKKVFIAPSNLCLILFEGCTSVRERGTKSLIFFYFPHNQQHYGIALVRSTFVVAFAGLGCRGVAKMWFSTERYCDHGVTKTSWDVGWPSVISTENSKHCPYPDLPPKFCCWLLRGVLVWVGICSLFKKIGRSFEKFSCQSLISVHWTYSVFNFSLSRVFYSHWLEHFHKRTRLSHESIFFDNFKSLNRGMEMWNLRKMSTDIFFPDIFFLFFS